MSNPEASVSCSHHHDINIEVVQNTNTNNSQVEEGSQSDNELLKGLLTDNYCHVCEATLLFESQRVAHYEGKKHAQRVRLYLQNKKAERKTQTQEFFRGGAADPEKFCELCNMVFSSATVAKSHYEGKVHAKNMRKSNPPPIGDPSLTSESTAPLAPPVEGVVHNQLHQEQKDSSALGGMEVDLSDPNKYCRLCSASFNNPLVAQQHYSGRKHQRNQVRQQMLDQIGDQTDHVSSLTCPVCCQTFSSIEMYQAHMQGTKHFMKEKKVLELCKSQKKVYDSYQDELADYIKVQKARGLEPKAGPGTVGQASTGLDEDVKGSSPTDNVTLHPAPMLQRPPLAAFPPPPWPPQFQSQVNNFGFRVRGPVPHYRPGFMPHPPPNFIPGQTYKRGRSPDSYSSSSLSDSSSSYSSSSSSSSYDSRKRRRQMRKMRKQGSRRRDEEDESDTDMRGKDEDVERKKRWKRESKGNAEGEEDRESRKWKKRWKKERSSSDEEEDQSRRRLRKKSRRHEEGQHTKRQREEEEEKGGVQIEGAHGRSEEHKEEMKDGKHKHKKERKKGKEKGSHEDKRTEEERLWDETILGVF